MTDPRERGKDWVAVILAIGVATAVNIIVLAVLWDAITSQISGLSENATQILTGVFGGILGVLGSYIGYSAANRSNEQLIDRTGPPVEQSGQEATEAVNPHPQSSGQPD